MRKRMPAAPAKKTIPANPMPNDSDKQDKGEAVFRTEGTLRRIIVALAVAALLFGLFHFLRNFADALLLLFAGVLFGILLRGLSRIALRWLRLPVGWALALVVAIIVAAVGGFLWLAGPRMAHELRQLSAQLPQAIDSLQHQIRHSDWGGAVLDGLPSLSKVHLSPSLLLGPVSEAFTITLEIIGGLVFVFFLGLYMAATPKVYLDGILLLISPVHRTRGREVLMALDTALSWWLLGRVVTMTVMGILTTLVLWLANIPLALVLGVIAGLLLFVPYVGAVLAAVPAMLIALMQSPAKALWVAAIYTGVHVFEGYCITPFVQKRAVTLPPALLLSVQILSGAFFGFMGIVFSTPLTVVVIVLVQTLYVQDILGEEVVVLGENEKGGVRQAVGRS